MGVLVIGMHRSGTSALAGALEAMGLDAGPSEELMAGDEGNPEGYFELRAVAALDDEILEHFGGRWDSPPTLPTGWDREEAGREFAARAEATLAERYDGDGFVVKDPRMSLLLPLWRGVCGEGSVAVVIVRDPLEVAASLTRRNDLPTHTGLALWAAYNRSLLRDLEGVAVHLVSYADLVDQPAKVLGEVAESLGAWGVVGEIDLTAAIATVHPELRRNTVARSSDPASSVPTEIAELETLLLDRRGRHDHFSVDADLSPSWWEDALLTERRRLLQWALPLLGEWERHARNLEAENEIFRERAATSAQEAALLQERVDQYRKMVPSSLRRVATKFSGKK